MPPEFQIPQPPLLYLITSGQTTSQTTSASKDFADVLQLIQAAVTARIDLVQIREKNLSASVLYDLTASAAVLTRGRATKLLVNDRADVAATAGADGVHLTTTSLPTAVVRQAFGEPFLIGVSTHSVDEVRRASRSGANFVVFGPIFETPGKQKYGEPRGLKRLETIASELAPFPVLALGGITLARAPDCLKVGAHGIAAVRMLSDPGELDRIVSEIREGFKRSKAGKTGV